MSTSAPDYAALVARVEQLAAERPEAYRRRLLIVAGLGYGYIVLVILGLLGLFAGLLLLAAYSMGGFLSSSSSLVGGVVRYALLMSLLPIAGLVYYVVRGLFTRGAAPEGLVLNRDLTLQLFETLDAIRAATGAPTIHRVVLTDDFNAAVQQQSRFGVPGWTRNHLILGLPLLDALSPEEASAVLAHEMGHLHRRQTKLGGQIFRVHATWVSLLEGLVKGGSTLRLLFLPFFGRYVPYFTAYASVAIRAHELDADRAAADLVGPRAVADGLTRLELVGAYLEREFWPRLCERAARSPGAPGAVFSEICAATRAAPAAVAAGTRFITLEDALTKETATFDSHPALQVRLAALGQEPRVPPPIDVSAADVLLGEALPTLRDRLNEIWHAEASAWWQEQYDDACERADALQKLEAETAGRRPTVREQWLHACLVESVRGAAAALPHFQALIQARPRDAKAHLQIARLLLKRGDLTGVESIEVAVRLDPWLAEPALDLVQEHIDARTAPAEHALCTRWLGRVIQTLAEKAGEAISVKERPLLPHSIGDDELAPLIDLIDGCDTIEDACLVRQEWSAFPELRLHLLVLTMVPWARRDDAAIMNVLADVSDAPELPAKTFFTIVANEKDADLQRVRQTPGFTIYRRNPLPEQRAA